MARQRDVFIIACWRRLDSARPTPHCVNHYNKHMDGVDHLDQMRAVWGELAGSGGSTYSGVSSTWESSTRTSCGWPPTVLFLPTSASSRSSHSSSSSSMTCATDTMRGYSGSLLSRISAVYTCFDFRSTKTTILTKSAFKITAIPILK